jgi:hypothetical protein
VQAAIEELSFATVVPHAVEAMPKPAAVELQELVAAPWSRVRQLLTGGPCRPQQVTRSYRVGDGRGACSRGVAADSCQAEQAAPDEAPYPVPDFVAEVPYPAEAAPGEMMAVRRHMFGSQAYFLDMDGLAACFRSLW